jgi:hypothetical protein
VGWPAVKVGRKIREDEKQKKPPGATSVATLIAAAVLIQIGASRLKRLAMTSRWISFTFDDGLELGTRKACSIFDHYGFKGGFYPVTGWVDPRSLSIRDPFNAGRPHGDWPFWRSISKRGHEVGSHTQSHFRLGGKRALMQPLRVWREINDSYFDLIRELGCGNLTISLPWNTRSVLSQFLIPLRYLGCVAAAEKIQYNDKQRPQPYWLTAWAPGSATPISDVLQVIDEIPPEGWLVFQFHAFDDEGYEPLTTERLSEICDFIGSRNGLEVVTVRDGLLKLSRSS